MSDGDADPLAPYRAKRDFARTREPAGGPARGHSFCVQQHLARRLHYDVRLELDGVLKSWAVPRGPSLVPGEKRLAMQTEDHPVDYGDFEGVIPEGEYGGGTVLLWDRGRWDELGDPREGLRNGKLDFVLHGTKLHGKFAFVRLRDASNAWLLVKARDEHARTHGEIVHELPRSVLSDLDLLGIAERDGASEKQLARVRRMFGPR